MKKLIFFLPLLLLLASCGKKETASAAAPSPDSLAQAVQVREVVGIAIIEPSERIVTLAAEQSGYIREVKAKTGDAVRKGQTLVVLAADVESAQVAQANAKIATQNDAVAVARENLKLLQVQRDKAKADLDRDEALFKGNAITRQQFDNTRAALTELDQQIRAQ
ncbi:MAG TPA: biotin/lipoyl-binding protein, partial [Saprospiraceae bacterium]|nr:biotin/lipoyl-binding protein [Saprospiraceae bacterium]